MARMNFNADSGALELPSWFNLPAEMRARRQWAVSSLVMGADGKPDKRPLLLNGDAMEWRNPLQWLSFEEAVGSGYPAIGFILTPIDPFTIIDLDVKDGMTETDQERQSHIFRSFPSYSELSVSGRGLHIILQGRIGGGVRRDFVEVYDQERYMICTGNIVTPGPVQSHPELLEKLVDQMGGVKSTTVIPDSQPEKMADDALIEKMAGAKNGDKFKRLFYGPVEMGSENDAALFSLLAFWTKNHDQILRLFARSALYRPRGEADGKKGHNEKSYHEKYLMETLAGALRSAAQWEQGAEANIAHGRELANALIARQTTTPAEEPVVFAEMDFPPGLVGEVARYIYHASPYPGREVAIAGALGFMAGVFGRQYNISHGAGLNLYIALLAPSGSGKDHARVGINALFGALAKEAPGVLAFKGPEAISSTGLRKSMGEQNPAMISMLGEIGSLLRAMLAKRAGENDMRLKRALLEIYSSATRGGGLQATGHSKKEDRAEAVDFPAFTIFGESTQTEFYKAITEDSFADGLLPRFLPIIYSPPQADNYNRNRITTPPESLQQRLMAMVGYVMQLQGRGDAGFIEIDITCQAEADAMRVEYLLQSRNPNLPETDPERLMATRAYLQVMKVAGLLAVGRAQPGQVPTVVTADIQWAKRLVDAGIKEIVSRRDKGEFSATETRKVPAIEEATERYFKYTDAQKKNKKVPVALLAHPHLIPYSYYYRVLKDKVEFNESPRGLAAAVKDALATAVDLGMLQRLTDQQVLDLVGKPLKDIYCLAGE
jgi:hypothetical protein